jgi:hypothetical protein
VRVQTVVGISVVRGDSRSSDTPPMTDHPMVILPGSARASATATLASTDFGPRSMRMATPVNSDPPGALHRALRAATRSDHALLDRSVLRFDLTRRDHYGQFLQLHWPALRDLEADWSAEDDTDFIAMLRCVRSDLHRLRISTSECSPAARAPLRPPTNSGDTGSCVPRCCIATRSEPTSIRR